LLMSASDDRRLVLYDTRTASASSANSSTGVVASLTGHSSWVLSADISPDGRLAASGCVPHGIRIHRIS
jgi:WD repeat-containing protein 61